MIFLDRSIPRSVATALRDERDDVIYLDEHFPPRTPDAVWLAEAGRQGWIIITRDKRIRLRRHERDAGTVWRVGCFILAARLTLAPAEQAAFIRRHLTEMERHFAETPRPFIFTIDSRGTFRRRF